MARVYIGGEAMPKTGTVHAALLSQHSKFFDQAIKTGKRNAFGEHILSCPEENVDVFKTFVQFLYTGDVYLAADDAKHEAAGDDAAGDEAAEDEDSDDEYVRIANRWNLGENIDSTTFKDALVDTLISKIVKEKKSPLGMHHVLRERFHAESGMRKLLVDIAVHKWGDVDVEG